MNLTDLTHLLNERAVPAPEAALDARLAGVQAKVKSRQRRRAGTAVACVVLAILGAIYVFVTPSDRSSQPAVRTVEGFPEYAFGTRVVTATGGVLPDRTIKFTFVPDTLDMKIFLRCDIGPERVLQVSVSINDSGNIVRDCGPGQDEPTTLDTWADRRVVVGRPSEVVMTVHGEVQSGDSRMPQLPVPGSGTYGIAIGEAVPTAEYQYPPHPAALQPLGQLMPNPLAVLSASSPGSRSFAWPDGVVLDMRLNAPGKLQVLVNDVPVGTCESWDYQVRTCGGLLSQDDSVGRRVPFAEGQPVQVSVITERVTGEWLVAVYR
jgi:hypothetical protein